MLSYEVGTVLLEENVILFYGLCFSNNNNKTVIIKSYLARIKDKNKPTSKFNLLDEPDDMTKIP
jgi:hypothetical protein